MDNETTILFPHQDIDVRGRKITVRELAWPKALQFLKLLAEKAGPLLKVAEDGTIQGGVSLDQLTALITGAEDLSRFLILESTGLAPEQFEDLRVSEAVRLLDKALEVNLSDDLLKKVGALGQRFAGLAPGAAGASGKSTTSSSGRVTAAPTSTAQP